MGNFLIIGGSSGIGAELARRMSKNNRVFATYHTNVRESNLERLSYHSLNVLEDTLNLDFLPEQLDGVAYCPGSINLKPFHRLTAESFVDDYRLQVLGAIKTVQNVLPRLKQSSNAAIVFFSTVAVQAGFALHSQVSASKGALEGLTRALAAELSPKIRVNAIAPSLTDTSLAAQLLNTPEKREANAQRHPLKRIGSSGEIASLAAYLLQENSGWITGQIFPVDGGLSVIRG